MLHHSQVLQTNLLPSQIILSSIFLQIISNRVAITFWSLLTGLVASQLFSFVASPQTLPTSWLSARGSTERTPAQVIFGRNLLDFLTAPLLRYRPKPQWILQKDDREKALRKRALMNMEQLTLGTKHVPSIGSL